jgi:hypothetical protein
MAKTTITLQEKTDALAELIAAEGAIVTAKTAVHGLPPSPSNPNEFTVSQSVGNALDSALDNAKGGAMLAAIDLGGKPCGGGRPC